MSGPATPKAAGIAQSPDFAPYLYGATLGSPSKGRPERVLRHLKSTGAIPQEDTVADSRAAARGSLPGTARNGFPTGGGYAYNGSGRSLHEDEAAALLTRGLEPAGAPRPRPKAAERKRCPDCGQPAPDHLIVCSRALAGAPSLEAGPVETATRKMPKRCRCGYIAGSGNCLATHGGAR